MTIMPDALHRLALLESIIGAVNLGAIVLDEAQAIKNTDIAEELALPPVKIHCSILAEDAIKAAIADYKQKKGLE